MVHQYKYLRKASVLNKNRKMDYDQKHNIYVNDIVYSTIFASDLLLAEV
jgi:hypothetical protein